jgi:hypothetical protein
MSAVNFSVTRADTKNVLDENGTLSSVAINTPAFEYNANGSYKGLLVESASENLLLDSEVLEDTASGSDWGNLDVTVTNNSIAAPDGNTTADTITEDATTAIHRCRQTLSLTAETYTLSAFFKAKDRTVAGLGLYDGSAYVARASFNLSTGAVGTVNQGTAGIVDYGNGWYRCFVTGDITGSVTAFAELFINQVTSYAGDGTSGIYAWGAQLEVGGVSSYIATTTTTVTRALDQIQKTSGSTYIGQTAGTIYAEVDVLNITGSAQYILFASESTTPADNRVLLAISTGGSFVFQLDADDGATDIDFSTTATTGTHKLALVYESGDVRAYLDGSQVGSSTSAWTFGDTVEDIYLGSAAFSGSEFDNWIRAFAFYKRALTDAEAQILTN